MIRKSVVMILAVLLAAAAPPAAMAASEVIAPALAKRYISDLGTETVALLNRPGLSPEQRNELFSGLIIKHVDFRKLGKRVLGRMARKSSAAEREEFYTLFAAYFIDTVSGLIKGLDVTGFATGRSRTYPDNEVIVATVLEKADGTRFEAGWRLSSSDGVLKVVDIYIQGASAAGHFRDKLARSTQTSISGNITKLKTTLAGSQTLRVVLAQMN